MPDPLPNSYNPNPVYHVPHPPSSQMKDYPQEFSGGAANLFINYYISELTNAGFKQTLNSADPNGVIITYAKDNTFFTLGVKNIYTGSGDKKTLTGYKAYIEHN